MNLKISSIFLLMILLTSCTNPAENVISTPLATSTPTATLAPSETPTPKPTETPTLSPTPQVYIPPVVKQDEFAIINEKNYKDFYTPMTQAQFEELHAWMTTPEQMEYTGSADPVIIGVMSEDFNGKRMGIRGNLEVNIFPQYLVSVDGKFTLIIRVVVEKDGVKSLLPVSFDVFNTYEFIESNTHGQWMQRIFVYLGYTDYFRTFAVFIDTEDGTSSVEKNILDKIIDDETGLEPLRIVGIDSQ